MDRRLTCSSMVLGIALLLFSVVVFTPIAQSDSTPLISPISKFLPAGLGTVKQFYSPSEADMGYLRPDFILIENVHCNRSVQHNISDILRCLKERKLLPRRIAVEGAVGSVDLIDLSKYSDADTRRMSAERLLSSGEMQGVVHFVVSEGQGSLYGVENEKLYQASLELFRRTYEARMRLSRELEKLMGGLARLRESPEVSVRVSILTQDADVLRRLVCQRLDPQGIHRSIHQTVFAINHLKKILPRDVSRNLLEPVSAAIDLYALTRLRDEAMFQESLKLRKMDHQKTTVLVVGGFHALGLTTRIREEGYSYAVITPVVNVHNQIDEQLYLERILGHRLYPNQAQEPQEVAALSSTDTPGEIALTGVLEAPYGGYRYYQENETLTIDSEKATTLAASLHGAEIDRWTHRLRETIMTTDFSDPMARDIFTAIDPSWLDPTIRRAVIQQRAEML